MKDSSNQYTPIIEFLPEASASQAEMLDQMRANLAIVGPVTPIDNAVGHPVHGFGKGYELFAEDLHTMIDVEHLVCAMKEQGIEVGILSFACLLYLICEHDVRFIHQWMLDIA
jgi:hypothetical protein